MELIKSWVWNPIQNKFFGGNKKDKITDLEKQIEELDKQYELDVTLPFKKQTGISLPEYLEKKLNLDKEYIVKKVNLEVKLAILKGVD